MNLFKGKRLFIMIVFLILLLSIGVFAALKLTANNSVYNSTTINKSSSMHLDANGKADSGEYKAKTSEQVLSELKKAQINVTDKISSSALFSSGIKGSSGSWVAQNLASNNVIMQCEIYINNSLFAKSVPINPNEHIESITLLNDLKSGSYDAVAFINYYKLDTKEYISKAGYKIKLIVQ
jgi:methionine-rich copper-binding protein CopC